MDSLLFYTLDEQVIECAIHEPRRKSEVPESLVQEIWRLQLYDTSNMRTLEGKPIQVLKTGRQNHDAGPDFREAKLLIDGKLEEGDVEIHLDPIFWILHGHHRDPGYNNVILHVVLNHGAKRQLIRDESGRTLQEFSLGPRLRKPIRSLLHDFHLRSQPPFPCRESWATIPPEIKAKTVQARSLERLNRRIESYRQSLSEVLDPVEILYQGIAKALGYSKNRKGMEELCAVVSAKTLTGISCDYKRLAFLIHSANLFPSAEKIARMSKSEAAAIVELKALEAAYQEEDQLDASAWVHHRLRPNNRPLCRVMQLSSMFSRDKLLHSDPFETILSSLAEKNPKNSLLKIVRGGIASGLNTSIQAYLERKSTIGSKRAETILANVVIPWMYAAAENNGEFQILGSLENIYNELGDQNDSVTSLYIGASSKGIQRPLAEGLRELYSKWCSASRCIDCDIGQFLLKR